MNVAVAVAVLKLKLTLTRLAARTVQIQLVKIEQVKMMKVARG